MNKDLHLAAAATRAVVGDTAANLARAEKLIAEAARQGAELVLLPEACLTGYTLRRPVESLAEPIPGPLTEAVAAWAKQYGLYVLAGLIETGPYLTQVLAGPEGFIGSYRKTHLSPLEKKRFLAGDRLGLFDIGRTRVGLALCYEAHFPELVAALALAGADLICIPHASPHDDAYDLLVRWKKYLPARAYDNGLFLAACNQAGPNGDGLNFGGAILILDPKGEVLAEAALEEDSLVSVDLAAADLDRVRQSPMGYFLPHRRPELYRP